MEKTLAPSLGEKQSIPKHHLLDLHPDFLLGYLLGLIIGDGWIEKTKSRNYIIGLETTRRDYANLFSRTLRMRFPTLRIFIYERRKARRFPNGQTYTSSSITTWVNSKQLYLILRPCKLKDFHWTIPDAVFLTKEAQRGFLRGIFDAEGSVDVPDRYLTLASKHKSNLQQVEDLLLRFGVRSWIQKRKSELRISSKNNCIVFRNEVGFGYLPKIRKLAEICTLKYGPDILNQARSLRKRGFTYAEIAERLGVTSEVSVGEWLRGEKLPRSLRYGWNVR